MAIKAPIDQRLVRCAIYTRKSTTAGLELEVNSLEAQREVCQAYIKCQAHRNWVELPHRYDDGGFSGGHLERPALKRLLGDIEAGRIDVVVIYKIDRLSRSMTDFVRLMDVLSTYGASFVSVTQTFDTSDSMGRMVLNILLTFAQFERELMSDRVRDKKATLARRGYFVGGTPPFGFDRTRSGKLVAVPERAELVRELFRRFPKESACQLAADFRARGITTPRYKSKGGNLHGGLPIWPKDVLNILSRPIYAGYIVHRGELIEAAVEPLVTRQHWDRVQQIRLERFPQVRDPVSNFLLGILHDEVGRPLQIQRGSGRAKGQRHYRSKRTRWAVGETNRRIFVNADRVEDLAICTLKAFFENRVKLKEVVLSLGLYSDETRRALRGGRLAARRIDLMEPRQLRELFLALVPRAEVTRFELRLLASCHEVVRFLTWDGIGSFQKSDVLPRTGAHRFRILYAPAFLICGHPYFAMPIKRRDGDGRTPDPDLLRLLEQSAKARRLMLTNRTQSVGELAKQMNLGPSYFARLLRLNYLAPDIQTAIVDGTQPSELTRHKILFGSLPLDWDQQRQLMGFGAL